MLLGLMTIVLAAVAARVGAKGATSVHAIADDAAPVVMVPLVLWLFVSERYVVTLGVVLVYLGVFDGSLKLITGSNIATLGRDALVGAITLGAVARLALRRPTLKIPPLGGFVLAWIAVVVMQLANPSDLSLVHALAALRQHLEFVPLFFFGYLLLRSERRIMGLLLLLVVVAAANGIVSLVQTELTPAQLASWGPGYRGLEYGTATEVARVFVNASHQAAVRPPGLGGADGFGGFLCLIALPGILVLLGSGTRAAKLGWLLIPATVAILVGIVTSQTRLDVVGAVLVVVAFAALTLTSRRGLIALVLTVVVGFVGYFAISAFTASSANRYSSITPSKLLGTAVTSRQGTLALIPTYMTSYPLGAGLGSTGPAAGSTVGGNVLSRGLNGESEFTFLLVETGIPGLLVMVAFMLAVIRSGIALRRVAAPGVQRSLMALTAVMIAFLACWLFTPLTADSPGSPFLWLTAGCIGYWYGELRAGRLPTRARRIQETLARR